MMNNMEKQNKKTSLKEKIKTGVHYTGLVGLTAGALLAAGSYCSIWGRAGYVMTKPKNPSVNAYMEAERDLNYASQGTPRYETIRLEGESLEGDLEKIEEFKKKFPNSYNYNRKKELENTLENLRLAYPDIEKEVKKKRALKASSEKWIKYGITGTGVGLLTMMASLGSIFAVANDDRKDSELEGGLKGGK